MKVLRAVLGNGIKDPVYLFNHGSEKKRTRELSEKEYQDPVGFINPGSEP